LTYVKEMPRRDDIRKVDLLLPSSVWSKVEAVARRRQFAMSFRTALDEATMGEDIADWVSPRATEGEPVHRITIEITLDQDRRVRALMSANPSWRGRGRMDFLVAVARTVGDRWN
jgi:hypothetical protein